MSQSKRRTKSLTQGPSVVAATLYLRQWVQTRGP